MSDVVVVRRLGKPGVAAIETILIPHLEGGSADGEVGIAGSSREGRTAEIVLGEGRTAEIVLGEGRTAGSGREIGIARGSREVRVSGSGREAGISRSRGEDRIARSSREVRITHIARGK